MSTAVLEKPSIADTKMPPALSSVTQNIPLTLIKPSSTNRAAEVDEAFIESILQHGVIQPIILRPVIASIVDVTVAQPHAPFALGETIYEIVSGERRWLGSKAAKKTSIPAVVRILTDAEAMELQIIENDQREDLSPLDRAQAYSLLRAQYLALHKDSKGYTETSAINEVAKKVSREVRTVYQVIQLGKLAWQLQNALRQKEMEVSHAYEICRLPEDQQLEILKWIRKEAQHSQGDIPSVRRLKREISDLSVLADEKRRQQKLPLAPAPGGAPGAQAVVSTFITRGQNAQAAVDKAIKEAEGIPALQGKIKAYNPPPQKVPTPAEQKKAEKKREAERQALERDRAKTELNQRIEKRYGELFFTAFASKAKVSSRLLTHVVPQMIFNAWECEVPIDSFAEKVLGWPKISDWNQGCYPRQDVIAFSRKYTRKFTPGLFAALASILLLTTAETEQIARYFGVDTKKLRVKAAAAVNAEEKTKLQTSAAPKKAVRR